MNAFRAFDWRCHEILPSLLIVVPTIMGVCFGASWISNIAHPANEQITTAGTLIMGGFFCSYIVLVLGWGHFGEWRTAWRLLCGTPVLCRQEMLHQWHGNTDTDPVWVFLRSTFKPWHYHNKPHSRQVVFLYRKHASLFKLAWG